MSNETILRDFMQQVWNEQRVNLVPQYVAETYTVHLDKGDAYEGQTLDHLEYTRRLQDSFGPFPDIHFEITKSVADGDRVAISWIMTGTNKGPIAGFPATGKSIRTEGMTIYHFNDGKVCGHHQVFDRTAVVRQLGFMPV
jgi:steroid delta-isomerase-like uncharacterized protein